MSDLNKQSASLTPETLGAKSTMLDQFGMEVLDQLKGGPVEAGDLVSKSGRDTLLHLGLCEYANGKWQLTRQGAALAMRTTNQFGGRRQ